MGAIAVHTSYDKGLVTPPAWLSATFLQTPRFSYDLYLRAAVQRRRQRPPKGSGTNKL